MTSSRYVTSFPALRKPGLTVPTAITKTLTRARLSDFFSGWSYTIMPFVLANQSVKTRLGIFSRDKQNLACVALRLWCVAERYVAYFLRDTGKYPRADDSRPRVIGRASIFLKFACGLAERCVKSISQLRFNCDTTTVRRKNDMFIFLLASNRVEWKQARAIRRIVRS